MTKLDDQHAYLELPSGVELRPADLVCLGHLAPLHRPLTSGELIPVVDDDYQIIDAVHTFF